MVHQDHEAVRAHQDTILDCLLDPDTSIRRRALDLSLALIGPNTVQPIVRALLAFAKDAERACLVKLAVQLGGALQR